MKCCRFVGLASFVLLFGGQLPIGSDSSHAATASEDPCFVETGHCILDQEVYDFWVMNGGVSVFGYPITPSIGKVSYTGETYSIQWFERNRLELHSNNNPPYQVLLGHIGVEALKQAGRDPQTFSKADPSAPHYVPETGHAIADAFWNYWSTHGLDLGDPGISSRENIALFGYPISEPQMEPRANGESLLTQWFERARFEYHPENPDPNKVQLGLLGSEAQPTSPQRAVDRANRYRAMAGLTPLQIHPAIQEAAQNHANYVIQNSNNNAAWDFGLHGEVEGQPGFTGKWPSDRIKVTGFQWVGGAEVMGGGADPADAVDGWLATVYHRLVFFDPNARYTGYGYASHLAQDNGGYPYDKVTGLMDFGNGPDTGSPPASPYPQPYPLDKQGDVPIYWDGGESPDPLPQGTTRPVGYPFTLSGANGVLNVDAADMRDANGQPVAVHPSPPDCKTSNCYALISVAPLQPNTTYFVHARGTVGNVSFDHTWQFTTGNYKQPR